MRKILCFLSVFAFMAAAGCSGSKGGNTPVSSSSKDLTSFSISSPAATAIIAGTAVTVTVPYATNVKTLIAVFTTTGEKTLVGSTEQTSGVTANDFTSPVIYTVVAQDKTELYGDGDLSSRSRQLLD